MYIIDIDIIIYIHKRGEQPNKYCKIMPYIYIYIYIYIYFNIDQYLAVIHQSKISKNLKVGVKGGLALSAQQLCQHACTDEEGTNSYTYVCIHTHAAKTNTRPGMRLAGVQLLTT